MEGPRISLDSRGDPNRKPTLPGLPSPIVPLRSRRRPPRPSKRPPPADPYRRVRDGLTLAGWCTVFVTAGFLAAAQPPQTYEFFSRLGNTRSSWDPHALEAALRTSTIATAMAVLAYLLAGGHKKVPPRLWSLLVVAGLTAAGLWLR